MASLKRGVRGCLSELSEDDQESPVPVRVGDKLRAAGRFFSSVDGRVSLGGNVGVFA